MVDEDGEIVSANYAKIHGDFPKFRYFYNPRPNDRNLEHDPEKNLADPPGGAAKRMKLSP